VEEQVPEISRFFGIIIAMYYSEHNPPHFHARYGSDKVEIDIATLSILAREAGTTGDGVGH
jgi:phosphomannomutase